MQTDFKSSSSECGRPQSRPAFTSCWYRYNGLGHEKEKRARVEEEEEKKRSAHSSFKDNKISLRCPILPLACCLPNMEEDLVLFSICARPRRDHQRLEEKEERRGKNRYKGYVTSYFLHRSGCCCCCCCCFSLPTSCVPQFKSNRVGINSKREREREGKKNNKVDTRASSWEANRIRFLQLRYSKVVWRGHSSRR